MTEQQPQAHWAQSHPARVLPAAVVSISFTITRGKRGGWLVWSAADADGPTAYCSTLAEAREVVDQLLMEVTRECNEPLYRPQQHAALAYQPAPQVIVPEVARAPAYQPRPQPQPQPRPEPQEPLPSFMDREAQERTNKLADQIAEVQNNRPQPRPMNGRAASWMVAAIGLSLVMRGALGV